MAAVMTFNSIFFFLEREHTGAQVHPNRGRGSGRERERERERERILSRLLAQHRAQRRARAHNCETMT